MKQICALIGLFIALTVSNLNAQDAIKKRAVQLSLGAETRGFTLSYEQYIFSFSPKHPVSLRGFIGYGFNSSNWTGKDTAPNALPGKSWRLLTYFPFSKNREVSRHSYYLGDLEQYSAGLELNYRFGKKKHFLEIAQGVAIDYFSRKVNFFASREKLGAQPSYEDLQDAKASKLAMHYNTRAGYRFVAGNGITLGIGLSVHMNEGLFTHFYAASEQVMPYLSLGYSF